MAASSSPPSKAGAPAKHAPAKAPASNGAATPSGTAARAGGKLEGLVVSPPVPAPPLALSNYTGQRVSIAAMRGKVVFVTFVYTHCPDICPLIVSSLAAAQRALGAAARDARFVAVTVDPRRDTPAAVRKFLRERGALGHIDYLIGSRRQLVPVWRAWHVTVIPGRDATLTHSSVVYGVSASGAIAVAYPANFAPDQIVHDVPLLVGR